MSYDGVDRLGKVTIEIEIIQIEHIIDTEQDMTIRSRQTKPISWQIRDEDFYILSPR